MDCIFKTTLCLIVDLCSHHIWSGLFFVETMNLTYPPPNYHHLCFHHQLHLHLLFYRKFIFLLHSLFHNCLLLWFPFQCQFLFHNWFVIMITVSTTCTYFSTCSCACACAYVFKISDAILFHLWFWNSFGLRVWNI